MTIGRALVLLVAWLIASPEPVAAQSGKQVKVVFEFRQTGTQNREAVDGSGRMVITDRGGARSSGRVGVDSTPAVSPTRLPGRPAVDAPGESTSKQASFTLRPVSTPPPS